MMRSFVQTTTTSLNLIDKELPEVIANFKCKGLFDTALDCSFSWAHLIILETLEDPRNAFE